MDDGEAAVARMAHEALLDIFLHPQQAPADVARGRGAIALAAGGGVVALGSNVISGGASVGDPLRAFSRLQAGAQGHRTLGELRDASPHNVVAVEFAVDRLAALDVGREVALGMRAKAA